MVLHLQVHALDLDSGVNGDITYTLEGDNDRFLMNWETGAITLRRTLLSDDENKNFELVVLATDKGRAVLLTIEVTLLE